jgi:DNA-directed RNA polymerase specialized sigma24 family protein
VGTQRLDFAEFYRSFRDDCLRTVLVIVGDQDNAQELVAEAFARACASWRTVSRHPAPAAWVVRTALNLNIGEAQGRYRPQHRSGLGAAGYYQTVTPGSGTRPGELAQDEQQNLSDTETTAVGAVWDRYYGMLGDNNNVMAYVSSVADRSGDDDCGQATDTLMPLTSEEIDSWSATRWITRVAREHGLAIGGENPGYAQ